ncbi:MAG TPA: hypothetical protein VLH15_00725 [Dehalococcoidales bacterium]|nr:hypothetical protein [Dehalococcoidales bacterium]
MKTKRYLLTAILGLAVMASALSPACAGRVLTNQPEPAYASDITEHLLLALNAGDYNAVTRDFDQAMLRAVTEQNFKIQFIEGIQNKIGFYQADSKRFFQCSIQAQYTTVVYYAAFSGEPGAVRVQISFQLVEGSPKVSGLFLDSPKLRG